MTIKYEVFSTCMYNSSYNFFTSSQNAERLEDFRKIFEGDTRGGGGGTAYRLSLTDLILMGVIEVCRAFDPGMLERYKKRNNK